MTGSTKTYGAYGVRRATADEARTGYAGEVGEAGTDWYFLGNRAYSTVLRRFLAPDNVSPFGRGGVNRYAYCHGDPINLIDPDGHSWLGWLEASAFTPGTVTSAAAALTDTVSVTSSIGSIALMAARRPISGGLFGWTTMRERLTSVGSALPAARRGSRARRFPGRRQGDQRSGRGDGAREHAVQLVMDADIPSSRLTLGDSQRPLLIRRWKRGAHFQNPKSRIWAADTTIATNNVTNLLTNLSKKKGHTEVTIYTGSHGTPLGMNWDPETGKRLDPHRVFFDQDRDDVGPVALTLGITLNLVDLGNETRQSMASRLRDNGVHIMSTCFGLSDEVVMESLNLSHVTVYDLTP